MTTRLWFLVRELRYWLRCPVESGTRGALVLARRRALKVELHGMLEGRS